MRVNVLQCLSILGIVCLLSISVIAPPPEVTQVVEKAQKQEPVTTADITAAIKAEPTAMQNPDFVNAMEAATIAQGPDFLNARDMIRQQYWASKKLFGGNPTISNMQACRNGPCVSLGSGDLTIDEINKVSENLPFGIDPKGSSVLTDEGTFLMKHLHGSSVEFIAGTLSVPETEFALVNGFAKATFGEGFMQSINVHFNGKSILELPTATIASSRGFNAIFGNDIVVKGSTQALLGKDHLVSVESGSAKYSADGSVTIAADGSGTKFSITESGVPVLSQDDHAFLESLSVRYYPSEELFHSLGASGRNAACGGETVCVINRGQGVIEMIKGGHQESTSVPIPNFKRDRGLNMLKTDPFTQASITHDNGPFSILFIDREFVGATGFPPNFEVAMTGAEQIFNILPAPGSQAKLFIDEQQVGLWKSSLIGSSVFS